MIVKTKIVQGKYLDSVKLMLISKELRQQGGVLDAVAILATNENREILAATDMLVEEISQAAETDIVIVIKAETEEQSLAAIQTAEKLVLGGSVAKDNSSVSARSIRSAVQKLEQANLCLISVAGKYAAREADLALEAGLHVMIFSDNVSLVDELRLKQKALSKGLLLMGPDCGTAIINGCPLGFANSIPKGKIGIVSAAGTGLQEVSVAIARRGQGISQAFGTGGRDGKEAIGGLMLSACLEYLVADPETQVIIMIAKTPDQGVQSKLRKQISECPKPIVVSFLTALEFPLHDHIHYSVSLEGCASKACELMGIDLSTDLEFRQPAPVLPATGKYLFGLYSGGTLCYEAQQLYYQYFNRYPCSNTPMLPECKVDQIWTSQADCFVDLGSDEFTVGRAHPMIDYSLRMKFLEQIARREDIAVVLLDIVLGYGSHPDPASELIPVLKRMNRDLLVVCHVLGSVGDPQDVEFQARNLREAGVIVFTSHHQAADYAIKAIWEQRSQA